MNKIIESHLNEILIKSTDLNESVISEIMIAADNTIKEFISLEYTKLQIKKILLAPHYEDFDPPSYAEDVFDNYIEVFDRKRKIYEIFIRYCYFYFDELTNNII